MKIAWFCIPAHGHTNPTLGVVRALTRAGHEVTYFSFEDFRAPIEAAGARFVGCDGERFEMQQQGGADRVGKDPAFAAELLVSSTLALDDMVSGVVAEMKPDLIVADSMAYWGKLTAMKHGIPFVSSTTTFAFNRHSAGYMKQSPLATIRTIFEMPRIDRQVARLRAKGYPVKSMLDIIQNDNDTHTLVYTSPYFQPCADTFSDRYRFIGPSMRPIEAPIEKTAEKTVYVSMGTVNRNAEFTRNCVRALGGTGWQVIVSAGADAARLTDLPENVRVYESVDQMAALAIADVFVTHCGMNSASEGLWYATPLVLFPQTAEQGAVARRAEELGAGIRLRSASEADILAAVTTALEDPGCRQGAQRIAESFRACGGAQEARRFLEEVAAVKAQRHGGR